MTAAAETLSLDEMHDILESWRRVAWLVSEHRQDGGCYATPGRAH